MPNKTLTIPFSRVVGSVGASLIGPDCPAYTFSPTLDSGYLAAPFRVPTDCDITRPCAVTWLAVSNLTGPEQEQWIWFELRLGRLVPAGVISAVIFDALFVTPPAWDQFQPLEIWIGAQEVFAIPPHTFDNGDYVALQLRRLGTNPLDTATPGTRVAASLNFTYAQRCQFPCS